MIVHSTHQRFQVRNTLSWEAAMERLRDASLLPPEVRAAFEGELRGRPLLLRAGLAN